MKARSRTGAFRPFQTAAAFPPLCRLPTSLPPSHAAVAFPPLCRLPTSLSPSHLSVAFPPLCRLLTPPSPSHLSVAFSRRRRLPTSLSPSHAAVAFPPLCRLLTPPSPSHLSVAFSRRRRLPTSLPPSHAAVAFPPLCRLLTPPSPPYVALHLAMAPLRLSTVLESNDSAAEAKYRLLTKLLQMKLSKVQMASNAIYDWDESYCQKQVSEWNHLYQQELHGDWRESEDKKAPKEAEQRQSQLVTLIKEVYGVRFAWILKKFPNSLWYFDNKRSPAGVNLLVTLIKFAEDAQDAASGSNATAFHASPTEHLPSTPAAVEETSDQYQRDEKTLINENLNNIQQLQATTAYERKSDGVQASITPLSVPSTSSPGIAKRRLADREDESGSEHFGTDVSGDQTSQYPKAKRVRQTPNAAAESAPEGFLSPNPPHDGKKIVTKTTTSNMSSTSKQVVQAQRADGSNSGPTIDDGDIYLGPSGTVSAESLLTILVPSPMDKVEMHAWDPYHAIRFVHQILGEEPVPKLCDDNYHYFDIFLWPQDLGTLVSRMPKMKEWATEVENKRGQVSRERIGVALSIHVPNDSFLAIRVPYCSEKFHAQPGPQ
ncbi:hypothetical protein AA0119_g13318 [Alternaria tenuissima]|uniref:Uncharacterized protein n=3 Tax=Alternaria tenuissima TaxID=119927 RepID=A0ABY0FNY5_9PLEO|nr:hypothetical protein AA0119_g13318 [Alternaria tenuissima]